MTAIVQIHSNFSIIVDRLSAIVITEIPPTRSWFCCGSDTPEMYQVHVEMVDGRKFLALETNSMSTASKRKNEIDKQIYDSLNGKNRISY
jgi:hypothetical protein